MTTSVSGFDFDYFESATVTRSIGQYPVTDGVTLPEDQYKSWSAAVAKDFIKHLQIIPKKQKTEPLFLSQPNFDPSPQLDPLGEEIVEELTAKN